MDEPSTGLDPASRNNLWNVVKKAKRNRAIILTSKLISSFGLWLTNIHFTICLYIYNFNLIEFVHV